MAPDEVALIVAFVGIAVFLLTGGFRYINKTDRQAHCWYHAWRYADGQYRCSKCDRVAGERKPNGSHWG